MKEYHKIRSVFKRDEKTGHFLDGQYSTPEIEYLKDNPWSWTEKVDGTNIRVMIMDKPDEIEVLFGGKTDNAQIPVMLLTRLIELFRNPAMTDRISKCFDPPRQICLYGEGYGDKIQKVGKNYKADGNDFVLFDVKIGDWWLQRNDVADVGDKLGLRVVPIVGLGTIGEAIEVVKAGYKSTWGDFQAEGLVLRPTTELMTRSGHRIITKIKHRDFIR